MFRQAVVLLSSLVVLSTAGNNATAEQKGNLKSRLLANYDPTIDPGVTTVTIGVSVICAILDKETGVVTASVWERLVWTDSRLAWDAEEYDGALRLHPSLIWTPDMKQYYSTVAKVDRDDATAVVYRGAVIWFPPTTYSVPCTLTDTKITCNWRIGSWTYDSTLLNLELHEENPIDLSEYSPHCPLIVSSHEARINVKHYECCEEPYLTFDATIEFKPRQQP